MYQNLLSLSYFLTYEAVLRSSLILRWLLTAVGQICTNSNPWKIKRPCLARPESWARDRVMNISLNINGKFGRWLLRKLLHGRKTNWCSLARVPPDYRLFKSSIIYSSIIYFNITTWNNFNVLQKQLKSRNVLWQNSSQGLSVPNYRYCENNFFFYSLLTFNLINLYFLKQMLIK